MTSISKEFSAVGAGGGFSVRSGDQVSYTVTGTSEGVFDATLVLQRSKDLQAWEPVLTVTADASGTILAEHAANASMVYRWFCKAFGETGDPVTCVIADVASTVNEFSDDDGNVLLRLKEGGVEIPGTLGVTGAATMGTATVQTANITTANLTNAAAVTGTTSANVVRFLVDGSGNALLARCATANIPTGSGFAKGCLLIATDGSDHTNTLFVNIGTASAANFNAATIAAD